MAYCGADFESYNSLVLWCSVPECPVVVVILESVLL